MLLLSPTAAIFIASPTLEYTMAQLVPFHITSGLPFGKTLTVHLPAGRSYWVATNQYEVLGQIREANDPDSPLIIDLKQFITIDHAGDISTVTITMDGADTRRITREGYYDLVMSDPLAQDARAIKLMEGRVYRDAVVTADAEAIT